MSAIKKIFGTPDAPTAADAAASLAFRIEWLHKVRLFSEVREEPGCIEQIARLMEVRHYPEGTAIIKEGEEGTDAFFLSAGAIKVLKTLAGGETFPVAMLDAKDHPFFGEAALLQTDQRSATILATTDCSCMILQKSAFDAFCKERPSWALPIVLKIGRVILERLHKANNDVILLYNALVSEVKGWNA